MSESLLPSQADKVDQWLGFSVDTISQLDKCIFLQFWVMCKLSYVHSKQGSAQSFFKQCII